MRILILGCGWVGEEVATQFFRKEYELYVTCTSEGKKQRLVSQGLHVAVVNADVEFSIPTFPSTFDYVLMSIPASSKQTIEDISIRFNHIRNYLDSIQFKKLIYLSSIGVYPDEDGVFTENYTGPLNVRLLCAEQLMSRQDSLIFRLGGLFGKNRVFAKYFVNRICTTGDQPANFIHLDDVVSLIMKGFESRLNNPVYNLVAPEHPFKKEVIVASASKYNFPEPLGFQPHDSFQKIVDGSNIMEELDYKFKYPSPLTF